MRRKEELRQSYNGTIAADWVTTRVQLPRGELLRHQGLEVLFHHVLRCRAARPVSGEDGRRAPLDNLQAAA
eukprot:107208-Pyramimonas_sp.AAC.1